MQSFAKLNGSRSKYGNFVWGAALTLAWKNLSKLIIKEPIKVVSDKNQVLQIVDNFNKSPFDFGMLSENSYYARAGFGNKTVNLINEQVKAKFPDKTTQPLVPNLSDDSIISYAYFFKKLKFGNPFTKKEIKFNEKIVEGFNAKSLQQKKQVRVNQYKDQDNFLVQLKTKSQIDHVFILKSSKQMKPEEVLQKINLTKSSKTPIQPDDIFEMPKISMNHRRSVNQLLGVFLKNEKFSQYYFSEIYQIIKIDLDETGVKVENQGAIKILKCIAPKIGRKFVVDKPFWIIMRQKQNHPYFISYIVDVNDKVQHAKM